MKKFLIFFILSLAFYTSGCNSDKKASLKPFQEVLVGTFIALPDIETLGEELKKANLENEKMEDLFPTIQYTFKKDGDFEMERKGLGLDAKENGRWSIEENQLKLITPKGSYFYSLERTDNDFIYLSDNVIGESMNFILHPVQ